MRMDREVSAGPRWIVYGVLILPVLLAAGCPTTSEGIDLTERGVLTLAIGRVSESTVARARALVSDNDILSIPYTEIVLADDQILSVNGTPLTETTWTEFGLDATVSATIAAVDAPDTYTISFDNQGVITMFEATPPEDFSEVTPAPSTEVFRDGFELAWEPSDDSDTTVDIAITGSIFAYAEDGSVEVVEYAVTLQDLADDGDVTIGPGALYQFLAGDLSVTLTRVKSITQKLGFSAGTIRLEIDYTVPLTLIESSTEVEE